MIIGFCIVNLLSFVYPTYSCLSAIIKLQIDMFRNCYRHVARTVRRVFVIARKNLEETKSNASK